MPKRKTTRLTAIVEQLAREGCRTADYALSDPPPWSHLCAVHFDGWRVVAFPTDDEVAIVKIAPHDPASDRYREIAEDLGIPRSTEPRDEAAVLRARRHPLVDPKVVENVQAAFAALTQRQRRQHARR